jgi:hypothetical protein
MRAGASVEGPYAVYHDTSDHQAGGLLILASTTSILDAITMVMPSTERGLKVEA